jgi:hypothetical protein
LVFLFVVQDNLFSGQVLDAEGVEAKSPVGLSLWRSARLYTRSHTLTISARYQKTSP